jgi:hypothetical protein
MRRICSVAAVVTLLLLVGTLPAFATPEIEVAPLSHNFGSVTVGTTVTTIITIQNVGDSPLTLQEISLTPESGVMYLGTLPAFPHQMLSIYDDQSSGTEYITVYFSPQAVGTFSATLSIKSDDHASPVVQVSLTGTGILGPKIQVSPLSHDFGNVMVGTTTSTILTITNVGDRFLDISSVDFKPGGSGEFTFPAPIELPISLPYDDPVNGTKYITIVFSPSAIGQATAIVQIVSDDPIHPLVEVIFTGTGVPAPPSNLVRNGSFESGTEPWTLCTIGGGSFGVVTPACEGMYAGRVSIARTLSLVSLYQAGLALEPNTNYRLSFAAYSTTGHDMLAFVTTGRDMPCFMDDKAAARIPWIMKMYYAKLGKSCQTFSTEFKTRGFSGTTTDARLTFLFTPFARAGDMYYIDDVVLQEVDGSVAKASEMTVPLEEQTVAEENLVPEEFSLAQNYPNPFNPSTTIGYALPVASHVTLKVYNTLGQEVATLVDEFQEAGYKSVEFSAGRLASGVYVYRLSAGTRVEIRKMVVIK